MATDVERLIVSLEARTKAFENALNKANGTAQKQLRSIERRFAKTNNNLTLGGNFTKGMLGGIAAGFSANAVRSLLDSATSIKNALNATGLSGEALTKVYGQLFDAAQRNQAPLEGLVQLYSRVSLAQKELGVDSQQIVGLVDTVGKAIRLSGGDAQAASGALLQLSQALGGGKIQAEEYNSLIDVMPGLLQAAATGIKEAGGSVAKLTALVKSGEVSSKAFFDGIQAGASVLDERLSGAEQTISGAFVRLQNVLVDVATRFDDSTDSSRILANFLNGPLTQAIKEVGSVFAGVGNGPIAGFIGWVNSATDAVLQAAADFGKATGLAGVGESMGATPYIGQGRIQDRIDGAFAGTEYSTPKGPRQPTEVTVNSGNKVKPISLADYPVIGGKSGGGRGGGGRGGQSDLQREIEQIKERTAALQEETKALAGINPLIDDYDYAVTKATASAELLTAAQRAGIEITPELRAKMEELAGGYAKATAEANKLADSQDKARQTADDMRDLGKDVLGGFISDLREGKSATEALASALDEVANRLLDIGLDALFSGGGSGIFSFLGFAKGGIVKNGRSMPLPRFARGGVSKGPAIFGEAGPEAAVPLPDGRRIPVDLRGPNGPSGGTETIRVVLQDDSGRMAEIADQQIQTRSGAIVQVAVQQSSKSVRRNMAGMMSEAQTRAM